MSGALRRSRPAAGAGSGHGILRPARILGCAALGIVLVVAILLASGGCHGRRLPASHVPNHGRDYDFGSPPCAPGVRPAAEPGDVLLRYLGASGLYVERDGVALLASPFFSNPGLLRVGLGKLRWDRAAIEGGLRGLALERVRAVLVGHSHYDHLGDLPPVLAALPGTPPLLVNRSGARVLAGCQEAAERTVTLEDHAGRWLWLTAETDSGAGWLPGHESPPAGALPVRVMPLPAEHAGHLRFYEYAAGEVGEPWPDCRWERRRVRAMKAGRTFAFLIDWLSADGARVEFRIHYQDAAATPPAGLPPAPVLARRAVDLAVVCLPSYWLVERYPEDALRGLGARHALVTHYEDFFRPLDAPLRFAPLVTDARARKFIDRVEASVAEPGRRSTDADAVCGPAGPRWTMPLPNEWVRFRPGLAAR